jgi:hypothetical protein
MEARRRTRQERTLPHGKRRLPQGKVWRTIATLMLKRTRRDETRGIAQSLSTRWHSAYRFRAHRALAGHYWTVYEPRTYTSATNLIWRLNSSIAHDRPSETRCPGHGSCRVAANTAIRNLADPSWQTSAPKTLRGGITVRQNHEPFFNGIGQTAT